ncbi:MAG: AMP-binding protein [Chloroflexota bacterium]|nr:AMP-binding protein [Chloroflexota bacterium]
MVTYADKPWLKQYDAGVPHSLTPYPDHGVHEFLRQAAKQFPGKPALITTARLPLVGHQAQHLTFAELDVQSDALAAALIDMGLKRGDRVALVLPNVVAFAVGLFGTLKAGGVVAATNPSYPQDKMQFQVNDCEAEFVITITLFYRLIKQLQSQTRVKTVLVANVKEYLHPLARTLFTLAREKKDGHALDTLADGDHWLKDVLARYAGRKPDVQVRSDDVAIFQYTGGTTGVSKGAMGQHKALVANVMMLRAWTNVTDPVLGKIDPAQYLFLGALPMFHAFGLIVVLLQAISVGATVLLLPNPRDVDMIVDVIDVYKPGVFLGVPAMFNAVNNHPRVKSGAVTMQSVHIASSGAAPLPPATKREFESHGARRLYEGFGMSEAPTASIANPLLGENRPGSIGLPLPDVEAKIVSLDDGVTEVPVGDIGELVMAGPNTMMGYFKMPTETANVLRQHDGKTWLSTGDIARMDNDGFFYIVDRKKDMALIGGFNVYPTNIEKVIKDHPAVLEVGVAAVPHTEKQGQEMLKAWIVVKPGMSVTEQDLINLCSTHLAPYEVPRRIAFIRELPKTMVGKTLRRELVQLELTEREQELQS